jgi:mannose/fructose-specific phosphotransferase system component IIA
MSETDVRGVVVAHGTMADGLVDAVRSITGPNEDWLMAVSNRGLSPAALADRVRSAAGAGPVIVFTDLPSGSCGFAARLVAREFPQLTMICGVNLAMLLEFATHRSLPLVELVPRLIARGRESINAAQPGPRPNGDPAVPR